MNYWREAFYLTKFELNASMLRLILCWVFSFIIGVEMMFRFRPYLDNNFISFDIVFLLFFSIFPYLFKPKQFNYNKISGNLQASPFLMMQLQLPIQKKIVAKSRFITYFVYLIPSFLIASSMFYFYNVLTIKVMEQVTFFVFFMIWLSFSFSLGLAFAASDAGDYVNSKRMTVYIFSAFLLCLIVFLTFYTFFDLGIVMWTVLVAESWPLASALISITLALSGWNYWKYHTIKTIQKLDYM